MLVQVDGELPRGRHRQGHRAGDHRPDRHGRRHRLRDRVRAASAIRALSMEGRMTVCNMAIEAGARAGMVAVDETTIDYVKGRPFAPTGAMWDQAVAYWRTLQSRRGREVRHVVHARRRARSRRRSPGARRRRW